MKKANLTLYTAIGDPNRIPPVLQKHFQDVIQDLSIEEGQVKLVLQDQSEIHFHLSHQRNKPEFIDSHLTGMVNFFAAAPATNEKLKENVLRQISHFNCVVGIVFEVDEQEGRTNYILNTLFDVAQEINGFLLYPSMCIYNGKGKLVFSQTGESELDEFVPIANSDLIDAPATEQTAEDHQRRERSIALLKEKEIPYLPTLPGILPANQVTLKSRREMIQRAVALFAVAVYSEVLLSENPSREEALSYLQQMEERYEIGKFLTPAENAYLSNPTPEQPTCIQFVWRYECCGVLLWAAGIVEELPFPSDICDVPVIAALFWQHQHIDHLLSEGEARTPEEILDAADLTFRYDWACVNARIHQQDMPASLDGGVVMERHYTFNWILGANDGAAWDDIQPNT